MASYNITWSCGHTSEKQLFGKTNERERYIEWAGRHGICPACFAIERDRQHRAAIEQDKVKAQEAAGRLQDNGIILPALTGTERQVAWAKDIRAKLLDGPMGWAIKIMIETWPQDTGTAKYWIDHRDRDDLDWARLALPAVWDSSWDPGCPEIKAAIKIMMRCDEVHNLRAPMGQVIDDLAGLAVLPLEEKRPALCSYGKRDEIDRWLVRSWARNGLIDWAKARLQASLDTAGDARAIAQQVQAAAQQRTEAERQIDEARKIMDLAKSSLAEAERIAGIASLMIGTRGLIDGQEFVLTDVRDEGASVVVREAAGDEIMDLSAHAWCQAHMRYLAKLADREVRL